MQLAGLEGLSIDGLTLSDEGQQTLDYTTRHIYQGPVVPSSCCKGCFSVPSALILKADSTNSIHFARDVTISSSATLAISNNL